MALNYVKRVFGLSRESRENSSREIKQVADYKTLVERVLEVAKEVRESSPGKIEQVVDEIRGITDKYVRSKITSLAYDLGHDRKYCGILGVDYVTLSDKQFEELFEGLGWGRITVYAYYLVKEDPDIILPSL